mmetsp:Transcript_16204/g.46669  ORF Transcript_16204/g.46669 Transcript_16204/m.46669 type:complete len:218 (-) Transcript_16204:119-772(-)
MRKRGGLLQPLKTASSSACRHRGVTLTLAPCRGVRRWPARTKRAASVATATICFPEPPSAWPAKAAIRMRCADLTRSAPMRALTRTVHTRLTRPAPTSTAATAQRKLCATGTRPASTSTGAPSAPLRALTRTLPTPTSTAAPALRKLKERVSGTRAEANITGAISAPTPRGAARTALVPSILNKTRARLKRRASLLASATVSGFWPSLELRRQLLLA